MPIELTDAIERAKLMAGEDGLLPQQSYDLLIQKLDDDDRLSFTMALVDRGIITKTTSKKEEPVDKFDEKKLAKRFASKKG